MKQLYSGERCKKCGQIVPHSLMLTQKGMCFKHFMRNEWGQHLSKDELDQLKGFKSRSQVRI